MTEHSSKRWEGLSITGELQMGVYYSGLRHKTFTLRVPVAGDLVAAQELHPGAPFQMIMLEVYRRQLLSLGEIPTEAITTELLLGDLTESDLAIIADADAELEKKLAPPSAATPTGDESNTPSSATATG
ncbi:hypothetical protein [Pseudomonas extremaustralis]|uniref:Phage tail assembly protein n=1 Tax=Pseudomonas extremaustralis TaxID=359110 RepID=A0A5C5QCU1_9PSED|nr:hypothetical protein [Pseudomonas extremaustralis]EZI28388.1 hypothetical protein PE143B_0112145 [Pseudomonas extremaustralis 14-3 substr. 14-3b]TWS03141.1 hypothetical protein FIV36_17675 [Pseudomonas extremaustralis]SDE86829.1 hypothetical protein SAMN05216591_1218 [Pseudomonas extremaustralis]